LVKLDNVKSAITAGELVKEDPEELLVYLRMREDWVDMKGVEKDILADGSIGNLNAITIGGEFMGEVKGFRM
jgi:hypothetical protein